MNLRRMIFALAGLVIALAIVPAGALAASPAADDRMPALTNLAHIDWLGDTVTPPPQEGHTTYQLEEDDSFDVLWTYAEPRDGVLTRVGGGVYDPATDTWGQGAFNADDMTRAAIVYLRHWKATGSGDSREAAYEMLRGVTYLQTVTGPNAGNVVLWMQPDGTLNPSAEPIEFPDPSDSDASYWLARTIWALGEGYAAFSATGDPADAAFAAFLQERMELSLAAVQRQVLDTYGEYMDIDGRPTPSWLIVDGADASAEAVLGLAAYLEAGGEGSAPGEPARTALEQLAEGIAGLSEGTARTWPFGAVMPWALSRSVWHAWGSQMPAALARASQALDSEDYLDEAVKDSAVFTPWMLTSGGPDQGRLPTPLETAQIAYGADSRFQSLLATAEATGKVGFRRLAGIQAAWFFGANKAGVPAYDPATGRTVDGIEGDGRINTNSGAESTIHGLLTMLALDANPDLARAARVDEIIERVGSITVQAEDAAITGAGRVVTPPAGLWTGEALFGGVGYLALGDDASASLTVPEGEQRRLVMPVVELIPDSSAVSTFRSLYRWLDRVESDDIGAMGASPALGALLPVTLNRPLAGEATTLRMRTQAEAGDEARIDAVMLEPLVSHYVLRAPGHGTALLRSASRTVSETDVRVPGNGKAVVEVYDGTGQLQDRSSSRSRDVEVTVLPGGFTIVRR